MATPPSDHFVKALQFTKRVHRDVYPAIDPANPELSLAGKVAIITGASRGIGANGLVPAFIKAGVKALVLVARNEAKLASVAEQAKTLNPSVETLIYPLDITDEPSVAALFDKVVSVFGHADILVNNAGSGDSYGPLADTEPKLWWDDFTVNIAGPYYFTYHFLKTLPADARGTVVNVTTGAHLVIPTMSSYMLSKLAATQLAAFVAAETAGAGRDVTAVALYPGTVETDLTLDMLRPFAKDTHALAGGVAVWCCSDRARFLNGRWMDVNWDVEDLYDRREEIAEKKLLQVGITGQFGPEQFEG
ncbi:Short chain dehydrogenase citE [Colletotrichum spinosum]|uniref:Short chain dehydrogenase citE n=1 Tax=Colletotrichum spinosum TaxID=1347390 RepID=A0A4V6QEE5_9PEZI|nr:Short chain dehydrogenase citE [Colletotrichum spinosum]